MSASAGARPTVVISQVPPPVHGSSIMTRYLLDALADDGRRPGLVDRRFSRSIDEVGRFGLRKVVSGGGLVLRLAAAALRKPSCAILFATNRPASFLVDVALVAVLRVLRVPTVHYLHTNGWRALAARGRAWDALVRFLLRGAVRVVCLGETLVEDVLPWVERSRVVVIPNASPAAAVATRDARPTVTLLFLSNLLPQKGAHTAVEVAIALCRERDDLRLLLAGADADPAYSAALRGRIEDAGLQERIRLLGAVRPERRAAVLDEADLLLFPSTYAFEAQPLTIVEAMAAGLPVVAYAVGGVPDVVDAGVTGELVPVGDEQALTDRVRALVEDPTLRAAEGRAARERHERRHTPDAFRAAWRAVLRSVEAR